MLLPILIDELFHTFGFWQNLMFELSGAKNSEAV